MEPMVVTSRARGGTKRRKGQGGKTLRTAHIGVVLPKHDAGDGFVDDSYTGYMDDATTNCRLIATVAQGTSTQQRIGRKIQWKGIDVKITVNGPNNTGIVERSGALSLVYDLQPGSSVPSVHDVYETSSVRAPRNEAGFERFRVLKEWRFVTVGNVAQNTYQANWHKFLRKYIKINKEGRFKTAGTGAMGDISKGALYMVWRSDVTNASASGEKMVFQVDTRCHFRDQLG